MSARHRGRGRAPRGLAAFRERVLRVAPMAEPILSQLPSTESCSSQAIATWSSSSGTRATWCSSATPRAGAQLGQGSNLALVDALVLSECIAAQPATWSWRS
ncbi:MAG: hypothetical protein IPN77_33725 [Sandaracinaceae bacterium]|nr:hypothetical protein [Sandaracinaceae bacterium]